MGVDDHFFEKLGGTSLSVIKVAARMREELGREVQVTWLFEHPTISDLARRMDAGTPPGAGAPRATGRLSAAERSGPEDIAIIGMSGRFPGARSVEELLAQPAPGRGVHLPLLSGGVGAASPASPRACSSGSTPSSSPLAACWRTSTSSTTASSTSPCVKRSGWIRSSASSCRPPGARWRTPVWIPERTQGRISLYAGAVGLRLLAGWCRRTCRWIPPPSSKRAPTRRTRGLATKASYKLRLTGESLMVYTACSTGLVAVHMACESLRQRQSDVALAGATRLALPQQTGYVYQEGMILSPDGHCRAFDARAKGTVARQRCGRGGAQAPVRCPARWGLHLRRHQGLGHQQRWPPQVRLHRPQRAGAVLRHPAGPGAMPA